MNKSQLMKNVGFHVRLQPAALRTNFQREESDWEIRKIENDILELVNVQSGCIVVLGLDAVFSFTRDPGRDTTVRKYGFLQLTVQVKGSDGAHADIEPLPFARGAHLGGRNLNPLSVKDGAVERFFSWRGRDPVHKLTEEPPTQLMEFYKPLCERLRSETRREPEFCVRSKPTGDFVYELSLDMQARWLLLGGAGGAAGEAVLVLTTKPARSAKAAEEIEIGTNTDWRETAERFAHISGEVDALWQHYESGAVNWSVHGRGTDAARHVDQFLSEARIAGRAVSVADVRGKFDLTKVTDDADYWLNAIAAHIHPGNDIHGSGVNPLGAYESGCIDNVVNASKVLCLRLVSGRAEVARSEIAEVLLRMHARGVHEILNITAPADPSQRDALGKEWIPRALAWDAEVISAMKELGCSPAEIHYVETFPLGSLRRIEFLYDMNSQWTICDMRRERLEKVIDGYLDRPIFTR